jgi:N-acetylmuramoyl-L-alanine amidase
MGKRWIGYVIVSFAFLWCVDSATAASAMFKGVRSWTAPDHTRVVLDVTGSGNPRMFTLHSPFRLVLDLKSVKTRHSGSKFINDGVVRRVRWAPYKRGTRVVLVLEDELKHHFFYLKPSRGMLARYVIDVMRPEKVVVQEKLRREKEAVLQKRERHFIVVVDPGHGGDDPGAIHNGLVEKRVTFSIAKKLVLLLNSTPGFKAYLTRKGDYYLPLRKRVEIAHDYKADLFISIHCNAAPDRRVRGAMVFSLSSSGASDNVSRMLAHIENTSDMMDLEFTKKKEVNYILLDLAQDYSKKESERFAYVALNRLVGNTGLPRGGVKKARFTVLKNPGIPSVLVEVGFLSNRREAKLLRSDTFRTRVAASLCDAVTVYSRNLHKAPSPEMMVASVQVAEDKSGSGRVAGSRVEETDGAAHRPHPKWLIHVVRKGETLWGISRKYGVKVKALLAANGLKRTVIYPGQKLILPLKRVTSL